MRLGFLRAKPTIPLGLALVCSLLSPGCNSLETKEESPWVCCDTLGGLRLPVASIAFSPDGQIASTHSSLFPWDYRPSLVYSGGYLGVWRNATYRLLESSLLIDGLTLHQVRFRSDGKQCLVGVNKGIVAWDLEKSQLIQTPPGYVHALSPDGRVSVRLESDENYDCLLVEKLGTSEPLAMISIADSHLHGLAFSFDNKLLALADGLGFPNTIIIWNLETGGRQCSIKPPLNSWSSDFSRDGSRFATFADDGIVRVWSTTDGSMEKSLDVGEKRIRAVAFSMDGNLIAVGCEGEASEQAGSVIVFDVASGQQTAQLPEESAWGVTAVTFSPDGTFLATGNSDGEIKLWQIPSPTP